MFKSVISNCRALEKKLSVSFLGPLGTFSEEATIQQFGENIETIPTDSIDQVFNHVQSGIAHYGVVPVENSTEGAISRTLDLLLTKDLKICGEIILPVHHFFLSKNNNFKQIKTIYAHGQSLAQCHDWLMNNAPDIKKIAVMSNAEGAKRASKEKNTAAIASSRAADLFNLKILFENIVDEQNNSTRFLVLSSQDVKPSNNDKTSIVVATKNKPVMLATGASDISDVNRAVNSILNINPNLVLMQCNTNYTAEYKNFSNLNLNVITTFQKMYPNIITGLSDHMPGCVAVLGAVSLGARVIEKHFTDSTKRIGQTIHSQ